MSQGSCPSNESDPTAWLDSPIETQLLEQFGGPTSLDSLGVANDINDLGQIVGNLIEEEGENCRFRASYWPNPYDGTDAVNLHHGEDVVGDLSAGHASEANAIRGDGLESVGTNITIGAALRWRRDSDEDPWEVVHLNDLDIQGGCGWELQQAFDVNASGWIVGKGERNQKTRGFLLVPACAADVTGSTGPMPDGVVDVSDLLAVLAAWDMDCDEIPEGFCPDTNGNCLIEVNDILAILASWGDCEGEAESIPRTVQDCIDKFGYDDPVALEACIQAVTGGYD